jgi:hypothetical protein
MQVEINREAENQLLDLHRGIHVAMEHLIKEKEYDKAELVLHEVDHRLAHLLNTAKVHR